VVRAIANATGRPYQEVYDFVNEQGEKDRLTRRRRKHGKSSARTGVYTATTKRIMKELGWRWTPCMGIGTGCTVHVRADELPKGKRLILNLSRHLSFVDTEKGVIYDTHNPDREGTRCVYGYWSKDDG
jgi:hypothetical protein